MFRTLLFRITFPPGWSICPCRYTDSFNEMVIQRCGGCRARRIGSCEPNRGVSAYVLAVGVAAEAPAYDYTAVRCM